MSVDPALTLLVNSVQHQLQASHQRQGSLLVIADEHLAALNKPPVAERLLYLTNRYDVAANLAKHGAQVNLSDFEFNAYPDAAFFAIIYRISKEKAIVHHVVNAAGRLLANNAQLILIGHKQEGLNSYGQHAKQYLGGNMSQVRDARAYRAITIERDSELGTPLGDSDYSQIRATLKNERGESLFSKPGVYGWKKIDRGSSLLIAAVRDFLAGNSLRQLNNVLDLGCGYGYLSVMIAGLGATHIVATDSNIAAVAACRRNFSAYNIAGEVIADDCATHIEQRFDTVVCNPPFHQGFNTSRSLTVKFLQQARRRLLPSGRAFFVVNQFVGIEAGAATLFSSVVEIYRGEGFKVLLMQA